ncbi:Asp-tRNA(Asn)/Glu-tRNA(Gln) amidotransferase subunit GatA [Polluticaenibacter yanchengensis]|uniref:Glutamyl-tRNA(Gln) amidotransferase subunit A n=1 Tax=Polluticaenibacter yanchengensis TaxID=3014562 RepID=A0ABT4UGZ1_9BACT|nr:Asp-tRNA(Asn)/Glu-tRNA(Gln) amidotransferase subunit GatA [Chitinophagaceae bacterium LY-5]
MQQFQNITAYQQALRSKSITCVEAVNYYIQQIATKKHLNAFINTYEAAALKQAAELDALPENQWKPLHGVVIAIKDVLNYKGFPVTAASRMLENYTSIYNATSVQRLLDNGAIIIGSCNCDEFAMGSSNENSAFGNVLNAADESRVPGGSSGGSAVAVQAGLCMASLGSDTGGSVRQPADFCGIVGYKPTYGRISRYGLIAYASSFDNVGIFANNVEDISVILNCIAGEDPHDGTSIRETYNGEITATDQKFRFAYLKPTIDLPGLNPEIKTALESYFKKLEDLGHSVTAIEFDLLDFIVPTYYVLTTAEASSNLSRYDGVRYGYNSGGSLALDDFYKQNRSNGFGKEVKRRIMLGSFVLSAGYYDAYFNKAQQIRRLIANKTKNIFDNYDALLMPVSPHTAFRFGEKSGDAVSMYLADIYTVYANLAGIPAISIPKFTHSNGMPFGFQVHTKSQADNQLLNIANYLTNVN